MEDTKVLIAITLHFILHKLTNFTDCIERIIISSDKIEKLRDNSSIINSQFRNTGIEIFGARMEILKYDTRIQHILCSNPCVGLPKNQIV